MWTRPPNFLLVDYYNDGSYPGSVFEVAAQMNNVTYTGPCCGIARSSATALTPNLLFIVISGTLIYLCFF